MILRTRLSRAAATLALGGALAAGLAGCSGSSGEAGQEVTTADLDPTAFAERAAADGAVILDVRTPAEFAEGHLPGAVNIDVESGTFAEDVAALDKDATYAIYCRSGNRSQVAMSEMADQGFTDLGHLVGGITAWSAAGGTVVTD